MKTTTTNTTNSYAADNAFENLEGRRLYSVGTLASISTAINGVKTLDINGSGSAITMSLAGSVRNPELAVSSNGASASFPLSSFSKVALHGSTPSNVSVNIPGRSMHLSVDSGSLDVADIDGGNVFFDSDASARGINAADDTLVQFNANQHLGFLSVGYGAVAKVTSVGGRALVTGELDMAETATLDLNNNALIVDYKAGESSPYESIKALINSGRGGNGFGNATWSGFGITSSKAKMDPVITTLGYAENADLPLGSYGVFAGQAIDDTAVIVRYTLSADVTLDGRVDDDDATVIGGFYTDGTSKGEWYQGDFDNDGIVGNDNDWTLLGGLYGMSL